MRFNILSLFFVLNFFLSFVFLHAALASEQFNSFNEETKLLSEKINCSNPKYIKGDAIWGKLFQCIEGPEATVKLFVNEEKGTNKVKNIKFLWNDWTKNLYGSGIHADKKNAKKVLSVIADVYCKDKKKELDTIFFNNTDKIIFSNNFKLSYTFKNGPAIDERMLIITEK